MEESKITSYDFSPFDITLELTYNERLLIYSLLQQIPVEPRSLSYDCAKAIIQQMIEKLEQKEKECKSQKMM